MKNKKKLIGVAASALFFFASATTSFADGINPKYFPTDIQTSWAYTQLNDLVDSDILNGYQDNTIRPTDTITRAEFVQMLVNAVGVQYLEGIYHQNKSFADVTPDQWYYNAIHLLASIGFVDGIDQEHFLPNRNVQRDEMTKMIHNVFQVTDGTYPPLTKQFNDIPNDYWAKTYIDRLATAGIIDGYDDGSFKPTAYATRAEAATMIYNALHKQEGAPADNVFTDVVFNYEKQSMQVMQSNDFKALYDLDSKYATGYLKALNDWGTDKLVSSINQGFTIQVTLKTEPTVKVIDKSALSATVQLNEEVELILKKGDFSQTTTMNNSGNLYLRRMPDNTWKIYDQKSLSNPDIKLGSNFQ